MYGSIKWIETSLLAIAAFNIFLVCALILSRARKIQPAGIFLLFWLLIAGIAMAMFYLIDTGYIIRIPWLFLLPSPLYYLLFPFGYLYIRLIIMDQRHLVAQDIIHFVLALAHLLELTPYFLESSEYKLRVVQEVINQPLGSLAHKEGLLPDYQHNIIRGLVGLVYSFACARLLLGKKRRLQDLGIALSTWLVTFTVFQFLIALLLTTVLGFPDIASADIRARFIYLALGAIVAGLAVILLFNHHLLYGKPVFRKNAVRPEYHTLEASSPRNADQPGAAALNTKPIKEAKMSPEEDLFQRIESFVEREKPYLTGRYSIGRMAEALDVPPHHISYTLKLLLKVGFTDYMNGLRLAHMQRLVQNGGLDAYTLEGLAEQSGFNSRVTFIRAVQKLKGMNPSAYFKD